MKNILVAALALGVGLALVPSALADSLGSKANGSNLVNLNTNPSHPVSGSGTVENGATSPAVESPVSSDSASASTPNKVEAAAADIGSNELSLLSEGFGERHEIGAAGSGHFSFADRTRSRGKAIASKATISRVANIVTLAETPEPQSLFLLGTGLMFMALVLFWKSAKRTTES